MIFIAPVVFADIDNLRFLGHNEVNRNHLMDAEISGNRVFISVGATGGLEVYNISNPANPIRTFNSGPNAWRTKTYGDTLLFLFCRKDGVQIYNISQTSPVLLGSYDPPNNREALEGGVLVGDTLYAAAHQNGIYLINIANTSTPQRVSIFGLDSSACWNAARKDSFLFIANGRFGLKVLGLSGSIHNVSNLSLPGLANDIVIKENLAVVSLGIGGLATIDISNPYNPILLDTISTAGCCWGIGITNNLVISGSWRVMELFDISNPNTITRIGWDNTKTFAHGADIRSDSLIVIADWRGISCYKVGPDPGPDIDIYPQVLDFGAGSNITDTTAIVRNTGSGVLNVNSISAPPGINVAPASFQTPAGDSQIVTITASGLASIDSLIIYSTNDPDETNKTQEVYKNNTSFPQCGSLVLNFTLTGSDGRAHSLIDYRNKVVFIQFGGAW